MSPLVWCGVGCFKQMYVNNVDYAKEVVSSLASQNLRVELDDRSEKIGYKIREAQLQKIPYMLIIGDKEVENEQIGVRSRSDGDIGAMKLNDFIEKIKSE